MNNEQANRLLAVHLLAIVKERDAALATLTLKYQSKLRFINATYRHDPASRLACSENACNDYIKAEAEWDFMNEPAWEGK